MLLDTCAGRVPAWVSYKKSLSPGLEISIKKSLIIVFEIFGLEEISVSKAFFSKKSFGSKSFLVKQI